MLILTRRVNERILIGDDIIVQVNSIDRGQVKLGISAPENVSIHREEIYDRIHGHEEDTPNVSRG